MFSADRFSLFVAMLVGLCIALSAPVALGFFRTQAVERGEFYALIVLSGSGMLAMAQSTDLFVTFIALEVMSLAIYVLVGFMRHERRGAEGAMKYFLLGAFSSAFFLYGIALVYGMTGTTKLDLIAQSVALNGGLAQNPLMLVGVFLLLGGFLFKVAAVPFHMWTPDAYQAAPSPATGFMAFGVKTAAFAALLRAFAGPFLSFKGVGFYEWWSATGEAAQTASLGWYALVFATAAVTMLIGNLLALGQTNVKRLLAYSSISHAGYLLVGLVTMGIVQDIDGQKVALLTAGSGVLFYLLAYGFTSLLSFGALSFMEKRGEDVSDFENLKGAARRHPAAALAMSVALLSLAGIPPTGGFFAKMLLFREAIRAGNPELTYLTIFGVLASVIGVYYYLRVIVVMYMEDPSPEAAREPVAQRPGFASFGLFAAAALVLYLGLFPNRYIELSKSAILDMAGLPAPAVVETPTAN
jgi:NADH-quinone oxidoreductase subunit N